MRDWVKKSQTKGEKEEKSNFSFLEIVFKLSLRNIPHLYLLWCFYAKFLDKIADIYTHSHVGFSWDETSHFFLNILKDSCKENFIFNALFYGLPPYNPRIIYHGSPWKPLDVEHKL